MSTVNEIKNRILYYCNERNVSLHKLSYISGLAPKTVENIIYGRSKNPKILTIKILCDGLEITLCEFFNTNEFNNLEQEIN